MEFSNAGEEETDVTGGWVSLWVKQFVMIQSHFLDVVTKNWGNDVFVSFSYEKIIVIISV